MDDQSSVTSNITYQTSFDERSEVDSAVSSPRNSPDARKRQESRFDEQRSEISRRISTSERQYESVEVSDSVRESVNLMSTLRDIDRGRSRSLRPVSVQTRARWAMLKSLAGFSQGDIEPETRTDEGKLLERVGQISRSLVKPTDSIRNSAAPSRRRCWTRCECRTMLAGIGAEHTNRPSSWLLRRSASCQDAI